jgi:hypothetical protein
MTNEQLFALNLALQQIVNQNPLTRQEILSWTLTYLVRDGETVAMRTVFIPEAHDADQTL